MQTFSHAHFHRPEDLNYGGETTINHKVVRAHLGLGHSCMRSKIWPHHSVEFDGAMASNLPLVLSQELCDELFDEEGKLIAKVDNCGGLQFLKVLKILLWDIVPTSLGVPQGWWPTHLNTLPLTTTLPNAP